MPRLSQALGDCKEILLANHYPVSGVSELESTVVGLWLDLSCQPILLTRENGQSSRCKDADDNTCNLYETGLTLT
jgi:hypothetical protein